MKTRMMMAALFAGTAALVPLAPAHAQSACNSRDAIVERLGERYHETVAGRGLQSAQQMIEVFSSPETGTFTVLVSRPDGTSCIVATGNNWHLLEQKPSDNDVAG